MNICLLNYFSYICFLIKLKDMNQIKQKIELSGSEKENMIYLLNRYQLIASEHEEIMDESIFDVIGFNIKEKDTVISFERFSSTTYMGKIELFYKNQMISSIYILSENNHWNGNFSHIEISDPYNRNNSRHDLTKVWDYIYGKLEKNINKVRKDSSQQNLKKDKLVDEFYDKIL